MDVERTFGQNLKKYRKNAGLTQEKISELLGITPKHLSVIENGINFVSAELIEKASLALGVSAASFFYDSDERDGSNTFLCNIDSVVAEELRTAEQRIKIKIRSPGISHMSEQ